jgi:hypothetical protein
VLSLLFSNRYSAQERPNTLENVAALVRIEDSDRPNALPTASRSGLQLVGLSLPEPGCAARAAFVAVAQQRACLVVSLYSVAPLRLSPFLSSSLLAQVYQVPSAFATILREYSAVPFVRDQPRSCRSVIMAATLFQVSFPVWMTMLASMAHSQS